MITQRWKIGIYFAHILAFCLCASLQVHAQFGGGRGGGFGGGGGGFGGFGGGGGNRGGGGGGRSTAGTTRDYPSNGTVGDAMISYDPETRRIIVITDDDTSQYISQVVTNLDHPRPQVLIKVVFLEVTYRKGLDIGLEGGYFKTNGSTVIKAQNSFGLLEQGIRPQNGVTTQPGAGIYQILGNDFQATLHAIAEAGKLEVLSRPSILARNNQQASITVGQEVPLINNVRFDTLGNQINTLLYQDVGIILRVTPFITSDGQVEMIVSPQISALSNQTIPISSGPNGTVGAPIIDLRSADTVVVTPDGQTVIIGGLMQNQKTTVDSKIPFLGDIPLLGNLFKHKQKAEVKTELLIFLTPHIVPESSRLASITEAERRNSELGPKAFTDQELDRFLDKVPNREKSSQTPPGTDKSGPNPKMK